MKKLLFAAILAAIMGIAGTAIADDAAATPYIAWEAQFTGQDAIGLVPEGIRLDVYVSGVVTDGLLVGAVANGVDYLLVRHDGVVVIDARYFVADTDGVTVAITLKGFAGEPSPGVMQAILDPEFEPPDVDIAIHGAAWLHTMAPRFGFLNHTVFAFTGTVNQAEGVVRVTCRPLAP